MIFFRFFQGKLGGLPYGPFTLYDRIPEGTRDCSLVASKKAILSCDGRKTGAKDYERGAGAPRGTSAEAVFARYLTDVVRKDTKLCFSRFHSGMGQLVIGPDRRRTADVTLAYQEENRRVLQFFNLHGGAWHLPKTFGGHLKDCPHSIAKETENVLRSSVEESLERLGTVAEICTAATVLGSESRPPDLDDFREAYCRALSRVNPDKLTLSYVAVPLCDFMHRRRVEIPGIGYVGRDDIPPGGVAEMLHSMKKAENSSRPPWAWPPPPKTLSQETLVKAILNQEDFAEGFVVVVGGRETKTDLPPGFFSFCHQRCKADDVGEFTSFQAEEMAKDGQSHNILERSLRQEYTMTRSGFHDGGECISVDYLRFLIRERGFKDFSILHFISYATRDYLSDFFIEMLQRRRDITRGVGHDGDDVLMSTLLKLVLNGEYFSRFLSSSK